MSTDPSFILRKAHEAALQQLHTAIDWNYAETRSKLIKLLKSTMPHLVYFYCHGGIAKSVPYIQVGDPNSPGLDRTFLRAYKICWRASQPLVFINGCHTAAEEPAITLDFVSAFVENAYAAGVIGTEITVFEPLARAFAEDFLRRFLTGVPVGEAVRNARLTLLKASNPLGLAYTPFVLAGLRLEQVWTNQ